MNEVYDEVPTMYAVLSVMVIEAVVNRHSGLRSDSDKMPEMIMEEVKESEIDEDDRDEDECK